MRRARFVVLLLGLVGSGCGDDSGGGNNNANLNQSGVCGDGIQDPGEQCDDGAQNSDSQPDACRTDCRTAYCGDDVVDSNEDCEGLSLGNLSCENLGFRGGTLTCSASCSANTESCLGYRDLSAGTFHTCGLRPDDKVHCWGEGRRGQLGGPQQSSAPIAIPGLEAVVQIASGGAHSCALLGNGRVLCWGAGDAGQLGDGQATDSASPVEVQGLTGIAQIAAGAEHSCAVTTTGELYCWGRGALGQLGDGTSTDRSTAVAVSTLTNVEQVACGQNHSCAVVGGDVHCWGDNTTGQLGDDTYEAKPAPVLVQSSFNALQVQAGAIFTCALDDQSGVWCWGANYQGQHGLGFSDLWSPVPRTADHLHDFIQISIGPDALSSCGVKSDGQAVCWGANGQGQLGTGGLAPQYQPAPVLIDGPVDRISASTNHTCAVRDTGEVYCWGSNSRGQIGAGNPIDEPLPTPVQASRSMVSVDNGNAHTCAIDPDLGTLWCWGANLVGQLGDGTIIDRALPNQVPTVLDATQVSTRGHATCFLRADETVWCMGNNDDGHLGDGTTQHSLVPVQVVGLTGITQISKGAQHTCARNAAGEAWCWGNNDHGRLGIGNSVDSPLPVAVPLTGIQTIAAGNQHTCAITDEASDNLYCWGRNDEGQIGDGTTTNRNLPTTVSFPGVALISEGAVTGGAYFTCAIREDRTVWCWGIEGGFLGDGTTLGSLLPVQAGSLVDAQRLASHRSACALLSDASVWCWGSNDFGQLGDGTNLPGLLPAPLPGISAATSVGVGANHVCVGGASGAVWCNGSNANGQRGTGSPSASTIPIPLIP